jgi:N-acetylmannosamine-6-phosphate 2-epimerase / N-acetylmannosamine kinase
MSMPVLAIDIGGTKILGALVDGVDVREPVQIETPSSGDPAGWLETLLAEGHSWRGRFGCVGAAVTGLVDEGRWSPLNPKTLSIPAQFPIVQTLGRLTGRPAFAANDAQAAAWGEFAHGAGRGAHTCVFLTISTGIGGGVIVNGSLLGGLAGHFGQFRDDSPDGQVLEDRAAGRWIAETARAQGHALDARGVFEAAKNGQQWADAILGLSARRVATLCANIQLGLEPQKIIIGGSIGLAPGFIEKIAAACADLPQRQQPKLVAAQLEGRAGIVGIAQLAAYSQTNSINQREDEHA